MRPGDGSSGGVPAFGGHGEVGRGSGRGSVAGGSAGSGPTCGAGGSITTSGGRGRGGAGSSETGGRSVENASSSIPIINRATCQREARAETFFRVRWRSTSRVEFRCDAEEIVYRTS